MRQRPGESEVRIGALTVVATPQTRYLGVTPAALAAGERAVISSTVRPDGTVEADAVLADVPSVTFPPKDRVFTNLESMIQQFKLFSQGFDAPAGEIYCGTEAHKGELGFYIVSTGGGNPYRLKIRTPSFSNLSILSWALKGLIVPDIIALLGSLDFVLGDVDR